MTKAELLSSVMNRLQICGLAQQSIVDNPEQADDNQRRAANTAKQLLLVARELREFLDQPALETWKPDRQRGRSLRRVLSILKILEETKTEWRGTDFADLFECSVRTIFRDLLALQSLEYPIVIRGGRRECAAQWVTTNENHSTHRRKH